MKRILFITLLILLLPTWAWAATYYISESTGADVNAGSFAAPWKTLDKIQTGITTGDKGLLLCGDTWDYSDGDWGAGKTETLIVASNVTIGAYYNDGGAVEVDATHPASDHGGKPLIEGDVTDHTGSVSTWFCAFRIPANRSGITINDIKVQNYYRGFGIYQTTGYPGAISDITLNRCDVNNVSHAGIHVSTVPSNQNNISDITITGCALTLTQMYFDHLGGWGSALSMQYADNYVIANNTVGQSHGEGISVWGGADHGEIYNNLVYETASVGIYISCCHDVNVHHNYVIGTTSATWSYSGYGKTRAGIGFGGETDNYGFIDSSGCVFQYNIVSGRTLGFSITDPHNDSDDTSDGGYGTNYVYNNLFIDNYRNYWLYPTDGGELTVTFQNNLSVINDTASCNHIDNTSPSASYTWLGNGWDNSEAVDSDYTHANDVSGDPDLVDPAPCTGGWYQCATIAPIIANFGAAAHGASSAFINTAQDLGDAYQVGLGAASEWPDSVLTLNQRTNWEIGPFVFGRKGPFVIN